MRAISIVLLLAACGGNSPENTGSSCAAASECYPGVDATTLHGTATCLTQYTGGYCTHVCSADADCCAVTGECKTGFKEVCSPFENQPTQYCFLSCDPADIAAAPNGGVTNPDEYCAKFAGPSLTCRSTGGGAANRRFCG
jgi:hypothetical protein